MDVDDFWSFIELSHRAGPKPGDREAFLDHRLSRISRSQVLDFRTSVLIDPRTGVL